MNVQPSDAQQPVEYPEYPQPVNAPRQVTNSQTPYSPPARYESTTVSTAARVALVVYVVFGILDALIAIRILLKLFAANPAAGFTSFVYNVTGPFLAPFNSVFPTPVANNSVFEFSSLLGLIVYALVGWGVVRLIQAFGQNQTTTVAR